MELMVVIVILGLLAMFILPNLTGKSEDAKKKLTCIQMSSVAQVLRMYKIDKSNYPTTEESLEILVKNSYFEDGKTPKDSWSNPFIYILNADEKSFDLISFGANKKEGGSDDIYYSKCNQ